MRAGTWISWMISWSVCQSSLAITLCGRWPPCHTPVTSIMAPVSCLGIKKRNVWFTYDRTSSFSCFVTFYRVCDEPSHCLWPYFPLFQYWVWPRLWLLCHRWRNQKDQGVWVRHCDPGCSGHPLPCQRNDLQFQNQVKETDKCISSNADLLVIHMLSHVYGCKIYRMLFSKIVTVKKPIIQFMKRNDNLVCSEISSAKLEYFKFLLSFAAVSAGAVITKTSWPAVTMRELLFCGMDSQARGPKSTRCDAWSAASLR